MMKSSVNRSASNSSKNKNVNEKAEFTTGVSSQQRSQIQSFVKPRDIRNMINAKREEANPEKNKQLFNVI